MDLARMHKSEWINQLQGKASKESEVKQNNVYKYITVLIRKWMLLWLYESFLFKFGKSTRQFYII